MAIYSTFFLCEPRQLSPGLPGWRLPLAQPVARKVLNPFTRQEMMIETTAPQWEDFDPDEFEQGGRTVVAMQGDYTKYLESRIPPFVQTQPHWCAKNLTTVELEPLVAIATESVDSKLEHPLFAHPSLHATVEQFPDGFLPCLKAADAIRLNAIAQKWAVEMSSPDYTHSIGGDRVQDDRTVDDALSVIAPIVELAKKAKSNQSMYLLTEG